MQATRLPNACHWRGNAQTRKRNTKLNRDDPYAYIDVIIRHATTTNKHRDLSTDDANMEQDSQPDSTSPSCPYQIAQPADRVNLDIGLKRVQ
jgi:hypothetical protein